MEQQAGVRQRRTPPPTLGPMLAAARMRAGFRGAEGARVLGISHSYLVNIEAGRRCPSVTVALLLADVFRLTEAERVEAMAAAVPDAGRDHPLRRSA
jgi:DNA-binding XRE family transcriptional regulator